MFPPITTQAQRLQRLQNIQAKLDLDIGSDVATCLIVAWAMVLSKWTQSNHVVFGLSRDEGQPQSFTLDLEWNTSKSNLFSTVKYQVKQKIESENNDAEAMDLRTSISETNTFRNVLCLNGSAELNSQPLPSSFPLVMVCKYTEITADFDLRYDESAVTVFHADQILKQHKHLVLQLLQLAPTRPISDISLLSSEDCSQLTQWNGEPIPPVSRCIHHIFQEHVRRDPNASAVDGWDASFTYGELSNIAIKLAAHLQKRGVGPEVIVPLYFKKSAFTIVAMIAVLHAGGAFMCLDPEHPAERLSGMLARANSQFASVLCSRSLFESCQNFTENPLVIDAESLENLAQIEGPLHDAVGPENRAMVQPTSGSTGTPKLIEVTHRSYCTSVNAHGPRLQISPESRIYQFSSYSFDACLGEIVTGLIQGACIAVPTDADRINRLGESITELKATWIFLTPSLARFLQPSDVPTLKTLVTGGEAVKEDILETWAPRLNLIQVYGPSECGVYAATTLIQDAKQSPANIGVPVGCRIWLVEPDDTNNNQPVPIGCTGEILIESFSVARGYCNLPDQTELAFLDVPKWLKSDSLCPTVYKTGDLARYSQDGSLIFVGRKDTQIKHHGQRIELADIEHNLSKDHDVASCIVLYPWKGPYAERLVAIIELYKTADRHVFGPSEISVRLNRIRSSITTRIPPYMVPSDWLYAVKMPMNRSTKIDRMLLLREVESLEERLSTDLSNNVEDKEGSHTDITSTVKEVFGHLLDLPLSQVSENQSFISMGGDSIAAMRMVGMFHEKGLTTTVKDILTSENIIQLSQLVSPAKSHNAGTISKNVASTELQDSYQALNELVKREAPELFDKSTSTIEGVFPCTRMQESMLVSHAKDGRSYSTSHAFRIESTMPGDPLSLDKLERAWNDVVQRHQALRTLFMEIASEFGSFVQIVQKTASPGIMTYSRPEDFPQRPEISLAGLRLPYQLRAAQDGDALACKLDSSHAIIDAVSVQLVLQELAVAYEGRLDTQDGPLYSDYVSLLLQEPDLRAKEYWTKYLDGIEPCQLKFPVEEQSSEPDLLSIDVVLDLESREQLRLMSVSVATLIHAAWAVLLSMYTGQDDVSYAWVTAGRDVAVPGMDAAVGPFVHTLISRHVINTSASVVDLLQAVKNDCLQSATHQHASLSDIMRNSTNTPNAFMQNSLISVTHGWNLNQPKDTQLKFLDFEVYSPTEYDITMMALVSGNTVNVQLDAWTSALSAGALHRVGQSLQHIVYSLLDHLHDSIESLDLISPYDRAQLSIWNQSFPPTVDDTIHGVVARYSVLQGKSQAICSWDRDFTFAEMDAITDQYATALQRAGVGADTIVPICLEKSSWAVIAMFAAMKAGGCFVLLDPAHPTDRLLNIIQQVEAKLVIVSALTMQRWKETSLNMLDCSAEGYTLLQEKGRLSKPSSCNDPESPAYIIFTSGSTGEPKGIVTSHKAYCSSAISRAPALKRDHSSRHLLFSGFAFDMCIEDILTTLLVGGCVCILSESERMNDISGGIQRMNVNSAELSPTVARMIAPKDVPSLKVLMLGGERLTPAHIRQWEKSVYLLNAYGPSECSVTSVVAPIPGTIPLPASTIGKGVGALTWVVNQNNHNRLVPIGGVGELLLDGPGLGAYLNNPEKNQEAFVHSPAWLGKAGRRLYKTGDFVQQCSDGSLVYRGRKDDTQVKLYGQRIELGEIETAFASALSWSSDVTSIMTAPALHPDNPLIAVFFTPDSNDHSNQALSNPLPLTQPLMKSLSHVEAKLSKILPSFMLPHLYIPMARMPTNIAGKIDRKKLTNIVEQLSQRQLVEYRLHSSKQSRALTGVEIRLQNLWSQILGISMTDIGAYDNFYQLGGDSVFTMRLAQAARSEGMAMTVAMIFKNPILADMAKAITGEDAKLSNLEYSVDPQPFGLLSNHTDRDALLESLESRFSIPRDTVEDAYPCTPLQEGLFALSMRSSSAYRTNLIHALDDSVSLDRLDEACGIVIANQAILRTRVAILPHFGSLQIVLKDKRGTSDRQLLRTSSSLAEYTDLVMSKVLQNGDELSTFATIVEGHKRFFVWTVHHCVYDGWMLGLILDQLVRAYHATALPTTAPFSRFAGFLQQGQGGWEDFWIKQCGGFQPSDFPARPVNGVDRHDLTRTFSMPLTTDGSSNHTTATIVRASWAMVVAAYAEVTDITFGATVFGRNAPVAGIAEMVGPTLATIPVRVQIGKFEYVSQLLDAVQAQTLEMTPFEHCGIQNIRKLNMECEDACDFQNLLVVQPGQLSNSGIGFFGPRESSSTETLGFHTYPLVLACTIESEGLSLQFTFDVNSISEQQIERLFYHFQRTVEQFCAAKPKSKLQDVELFGAHDIECINSWNRDIPVEQNVLIHEEIAKQVLVQPDAEAVFAWDRSLTYGQLDNLSNQLAAFLKANCSAGPEVLIPLLFQKSSLVPIAMLGVLKSGAGFVPLDASHPPGRLQEIINQSHPPVVILSPDTAHLAHLAPKVLEISDRFFDSSEAEQIQYLTMQTKDAPATTAPECPSTSPSELSASTGSESPTSGKTLSNSSLDNDTADSEDSWIHDDLVRPNNVAYIIFTSGSTGTPKGVVIEHRQFCSGVIGPRQEALLRSTKSRVLQFASLSFDTSLEDILTTLLFGGTVCIPSESDRINDIASFIRKSRANTAHITPSFANTLSPETVPTMGYLRLGGERMTPGHIKTWADVLDLRNVYGPTETSITATCSVRVTSKSDSTNIGRGVAARIWITQPDNHDRLAPLGLAGEMLVEGPLLSRGYKDDEEKTNKSFIVNPKWARDQSGVQRRFYKTGDICRYDDNGNILYIGRADSQVKVYGQRIELGEVEDCLKKALGNTRSAAVEAMELPGTGSHKTLVAFICLGDDFEGDQQDLSTLPEITITKLRKIIDGMDAKMSQTLPKYMIPTRFIPLKVLPTIISGKIDRKGLQALLSALSAEQLHLFSSAGSVKTQPETDMEVRIQKSWSTLLGLPIAQIGANDNFLRLGGDSIMAIKLASELRETGVMLSVADIFNSLTLSDMALQAESQTVKVSEKANMQSDTFSLINDKAALATVFDVLRQQGINATDVEAAYPCTPLQEGLLSLSIQNNKAYVSQSVFTLPPSIDIPRFIDAWATVIDRHAVLRTKMVNATGFGTIQVVLKKRPEWHTGSDLETHLHEVMEKFDIEGDLVHYALCTDANGQDSGLSFVLTMHHAVYDGWCFGEILRQVDQAYTGINESYAPTGAFVDFINHVQHASGADSKEFWTAKLKDCEDAYDLPLNRADFDLGKRAMDECRITIPLNIRARVAVTPSILIRAAWAVTISLYAASTDVMYGAIVNGRNAGIDGIESIVGPTLATIPVRIKLNSGTTVAELFQSLLRDATDTIPFEQLGIQNIARLQPNLERSCDFNSLLVVQPEPVGMGPGSLFENVKSEDAGVQDHHPYPLVLECELGTDKFEAIARYDRGSISEKQMNRILRTLQQVLNELCASPERTLAEINHVSVSDMQEIHEWNQNIPYTLHTTVQDIVERRIKQNPAAPAVYTTERSLTYGELDKITYRLAQYLRHLGIGPGSFVMLTFEKSAWHLVSMLSVIRAGAAFVPTDPEYLPEERLRDIAEQCGAKLLLTSNAIASTLPDIEGVRKIVVGASTFQELGGLSTMEVPLRASPSSCLFVLYTSGTTGKAKGVVMSHQAFASVCDAKIARTGIDQSTRALQFASHGFDVSVNDILVTIVAGGCVAVPNEEERLAGIEEFIVKAKVNSANLTPSVSLNLDSALVSKSLTRLGLLGEPTRQAHIDKWARHLKLQFIYGPTETNDICMCTEQIHEHSNPSLIGTATQALAWLVDPTDHKKLAPIGAVAELCISGPGLADGYQNDPDRTAAAFIDPPSWAVQSPDDTKYKLHKTGDLVKYQDDGQIVYLRRKDSRIKFRGFRIELAAVEYQIARMGSVKGSAVIVDVVDLNDDPTKQMLVAFVPRSLPINDYNDFLHEISMGLAQSLPHYMIPTAIFPITANPLTSSGKIDRRKLRSLAHAASVDEFYMGKSTSDVEAPNTSMQLGLQAIWASILKIEPDRIGRTEDFFHLGGDSISIMRTISAAKAKGIYIKAKDFFAGRTLEKVADAAKLFQSIPSPKSSVVSHSQRAITQQGRAFICSVLKIKEWRIEKIVAATDFQAWCLYNTSLESRGWRNSFIHQFDKPLNQARLRKACHGLVKRHEILRTRFAIYQGVLFQVVQNFESDDYTIHNKADSKSVAVYNMNEQDVRFSYDTNSNTLTMRLNHAQYDGFSWPILHDELTQLYDGASLPPPLNFTNCEELLGHGTNPESLAFWKTTLQGSAMTEIVSHTNPSCRNVQGQTQVRVIPAIDVNSSGSTAATIVKAAWATVLRQATRLDDVVFGFLVSTRPLGPDGTDSMVGPCLNIVPVRSSVPDEASIGALLEQIQDQHIQGLSHSAIGFRQVMEHCTAWPKTTRFSSVVQYQNQDRPTDELTLAGMRSKSSTVVPSSDSSDVWVTATPRIGELEIKIQYCNQTVPDHVVALLLDELSVQIPALVRSQSSLPVRQLPTSATKSPLRFPLSGTESTQNTQQIMKQEQSDSYHQSLVQLVEDSWINVFGSHGQSTTPPFWELWSDPVGASQLASLYAAAGKVISVETIVENPTMQEQIGLLSKL